MKKMIQKLLNRRVTLFWSGIAGFGLALILTHVLVPEYPWISIVCAALAVACGVGLVLENRSRLKGRAMSYGSFSVVATFLVLGIVAALNFIVAKYPKSWDVTKNKVHTMSDQTKKVVQGLTDEVVAKLFSAVNESEAFKPLLQNFKTLNPKFKVEFVDPFRDPTQVKQLGITRKNTLHMTYKDRTQTVEEPNEEKLTNALIRLTQTSKKTICTTTGHGERDFKGTSAEGYDLVRKSLESQGYEVKDLFLAQEGKVKEDCSAVLIVGPSKAFFPQELTALSKYLEGGGRMLVAWDINLKGMAYAPELGAVLKPWFIHVQNALVVDPLSRMFGADASVPLVVTYNKDSSITKEFETQSYFPFLRPVESISGAPSEIKIKWLGKTTPKSWGETDLTSLGKGQARFDAGSKDAMGPLNAGMSVEGKLKDSKAAQSTRLVVFGTSLFAINQFAQNGGNLDFFVNSVSWLVEDENLISIRAKDDEGGKIEMTAKEASMIFWITIVLVPLFVAVAGIVIWVRRRKL